MKHKQKKLVRETFAQLEDRSEEFAANFYSRLFELDPSLRSLFKNDLKEQGTKLMNTLAVAVRSLDNLDELVPVVEALGRRHRLYGVTDQHYDTVAQALLDTLKQELGAGYTKPVQRAWTDVYTLLAGVMKQAGDIREKTA